MAYQLKQEIWKDTIGAVIRRMPYWTLNYVLGDKVGDNSVEYKTDQR